MECPYCKEKIQNGAIKCKHCGEILKKKEYSSISHEKAKTLKGYSQFSEYYQNVFREIDKDNGKISAKWNWVAFLFGPIWYLLNGVWVKSLLMIGVSLISGGALAIPCWIYSGLFGNYDYYLLKVKNKQLW